MEKAKYQAKTKIISEHWAHYESDNFDDVEADANLIVSETEFINDYLFENSRSVKFKEKPIKQKIEVLEIIYDNN